MELDKDILFYSDATGNDITCHCERSEAIAETKRLLSFGSLKSVGTNKHYYVIECKAARTFAIASFHSQ